MRHPKLGFFAVCLAYCLIILDGSVLNVAVPAIRHELGTSMATVQWVLDGYTLPLAGLLLTAGVLGDRFGLRRMLLAGTVVFTVASAACAAAPDSAALIAARAVQGTGAAALLPATLALIPHLFDDEAQRARAAVIWVAAGSLAVAAGPLVGGFLIDSFGWRSIFVINLPFGVLSVVLAATTVPAMPAKATAPAPLNVTGPAAAAGALGLIAAGLILGGAAGWASPAAIGLLAGGLILAALFVQDQRHRERKGENPMVPPSFFRDRVRAASVLSAGLMGFTFYGTLLAMSVYFQQVRGYSPGHAGLVLLPLTAGSAIGPLAVYRPLARRFGHPVLLLSGFACAALGTAVLGLSGSYPGQCTGLLLVGGASTIAFSALTSLLLAHTPTGQSGLASGLQNTTRQSGALFAASVIGSVLGAANPSGQFTPAFVITGLATAAGMTCGLVALRAGRVPGEERPA